MALTEVIDTLRQDNSQYTSIGSNQVKPLRQKDSVADILAKIYNFMVKEAEDRKLSYELDKNFQGERLEEENRRHKELLESIREGKEDTTEKKGKGGIWEFLKNSFSFIFGGISKFLGLLSNTFSVLKVGMNMVTGILGGISNFIFGGGILTMIKSILIGLGIGGAGFAVKEGMNALSDTEIGKATKEITESVMKTVGEFLQEFMGAIFDRVNAMIEQAVKSVTDWVNENVMSIVVDIIQMLPLWWKFPKLVKTVDVFEKSVKKGALYAKEQRFGKEYVETTRQIIKNAPEELRKKVFGFNTNISDMDDMVQDVLDDPSLLQKLMRPLDPDNPEFDIEDRWNPEKRYTEKHKESYDVRVGRQKKLRDDRREQIKKYYDDMGINLKVTDFLEETDIPVVTDIDTGKEYNTYNQKIELYDLVQKKKFLQTGRELFETSKQKVLNFPSYAEGQVSSIMNQAPDMMEQALHAGSDFASSHWSKIQSDVASMEIPKFEEYDEDNSSEITKIDGSRNFSGIDEHQDITTSTCRNDNETLVFINRNLTCAF